MNPEKRAIERQKTFAKYQLDPTKIPQHIAIIMDGNGRWAKKRKLPRALGHRAGAEALRTTIKTCVELGISTLTVYVFSTENWKRSDDEVQFLMNLLKELIIKEIPTLNREGARVRCLGHLEALGPELNQKIQYAQVETQKNTVININLMINYGGRFEIARAAKQLAEDYKAGKITDITEDIFSRYLYTKESPELDIFIRTGGDIRISNYLLWQIAYSECFFLDTLWPDFDREKLIYVVQEFQKRDRRFGGRNESE